MAIGGELWTPKQLAERAGVSVGLVYGWCESGQLAHVRLGASGRRGKILVSEADWAAFLASRRVESSGPRVNPTVRPAPDFKHVKIRRPGGSPRSAGGCGPCSDAHSA
jgi:Helix-turn-helix domain